MTAILGIDPGPFKSAFCFWNGERICTRGIWDNGIVKGLFTQSENLIVAVEHLQCFGMPVGREVFETAYWIGEFRARTRGIFLPVYRSEVKMHFCNSMKAKDSNIRQALIDRFGPPGTKKAKGMTYGLKGDIWSAFAIAVYAMDKRPK